MGKYVQGHYTPENPTKYVGTYPIVFRSSWEYKLMEMFDTHSSIIEWASESLKIPYTNPFTNKYTVYVPDFVVVYQDAKGTRKAEIIEVKPSKETFLEEAKSQKHKLAAVLNAHKCNAAQIFAQSHGMTFRVMNEHHIFNNPGTKRK